MKKLFCTLLSVCLLALPMSASVLADDLSAAPQTQFEEVGFLPGSVPADSALTDGISLPLSALALSMLESGMDYDAGSDTFVWNALYYVLSLYGHEDDRAQVTEHSLLLPSECIGDFFAALFATRDALPAIPAELTDKVKYNSHTDLYELALGDPALVALEQASPVPAADGLFTLDGTLTAPADGHILCTFRAVLVENDTMFGFSIVDFVLS